MVAVPITDQVRQELPPAELKLLERQQVKDRTNGKSYPRPTLADIEDFWVSSRPLFAAYQQSVIEQREVRFLKDQLPPKLAKRMQGTRRFHSRLSHNEVMRVAAMMTRNAPRVIVQSGSATRTEKQSRWGNALLQALGKRKTNLSDNIYRQHCDALAGDGLAAFEFYMKDNTAYDRVDTSPQQVTDKKTGELRDETPQEINRRLDQEYRTAGLPFGLRPIDPLSIYFQQNDDDVCPVLIVERKPYRATYEGAKRAGYDVEGLPLPGTLGWPEAAPVAAYAGREEGWYSTSLASAGAQDATDSVLTMRYYDQEWYAYVVGGKFVDGPKRHRLPGCPVFVTLGMVTASANMAERFQGVVWGMQGMETAINDLMTIDLDVRAATARSKPVVISDARVDQRATMDGDKPRTLDLSSDLVPYLRPGQNIVDAFEHLRPRSSVDLIGQALNLWQRSGLNPIAQGESPGSDPAGYTVNSLTQAAQSQYEVLLDNYATTLSNIVDFARKTVRDTIGEQVSIAGQLDAQSNSKNIEWFDLGPDDVDEAVSVVVIDPLSDANKIAKRQSLSQGNKDGYVSRRRVQVEGYGIEDPNQEDEQLAIDAVDQDMLNMAREEAKAIVYGRQNPPPPPGPNPAGGGPGQPVQGQVPAPTNAPAMTPQAASASQGGGAPEMQARTALAGQGMGQSMTGGGTAAP